MIFSRLLLASMFLLTGCGRTGLGGTEYGCINGLLHKNIDDNVWVQVDGSTFANFPSGDVKCTTLPAPKGTP